MADDSVESRWFLRAVIFCLHCFAGIVAATIVTMLLAAVTESATGKKLYDIIFGGPFFFAFLTVGFCSGLGINSRLKSKSAQWVWVVQLCFLAILMQDQIHWPGPQGVLHDIWLGYFGNSNCGETECVYELLGTWPLFSSVGYSIGSLAARPFARKKAAVTKTSD